MDVQTENTDPPPSESQPSGKIRKGFKLFGKRKPGNIFSIRSKGDENNKSPVNRSKILDGLPETEAPDSEQERDKERGPEVSQGESEHTDDEPHREDGVLAAARHSISSTSSARSLSFLSLLRGGRRGGGDRRVQTVSQPAGRQRRGLKGLFGTVKFRPKDKQDKEEAPPSPLLMSSRASSVEIIKEDLTLTPKSHPRSLDSPETYSDEPVKSFTSQDSSATSPTETITPQMTAGNVSRTNEHVPPLPTSEPPMIPGETSLSNLLADISSLLTFDSISGGGDIMADVEAEWGKASCAISPVGAEVTASPTSFFSKPTVTSTLTSPPVSTSIPEKPVVVVTTAASVQSPFSTFKTTSNSSPVAKPSAIITTYTKSPTLTAQPVKSSLYFTPVPEPYTRITIKSTPPATAPKPSKTPVTSTVSTPVMSSSSVTIKSTPSFTSTTTAAPSNTTATVVKTPSYSPPLTNCTAGKLAFEAAAPPQMITSVSKPSPVATPPLAPVKPPPVTHSPQTPVSFTQPPPSKLDSTPYSRKPSQSSAAGESKAPMAVPPPSAVTAPPSPPAPVFPSTTVTISTPTLASTSTTVSKPTPSSSPMNLTRTLPSSVKAPEVCPPPTQTATTSAKTQPSTASVPSPFLSCIEKIPPIEKHTPAPPVSLNKMPPTPTPSPVLGTHAVVSTASPSPPATGEIPAPQSKAAPAPVPVPVPKHPPAPAPVPVPESKDPPAPAHVPVPESKDPPAPAQIPVPVSKDPPAPAQIPVPVTKDPPAPAQIPVPVSKDPPAPAQIPVPVSKDPPAPAHVPVPVTKDPPAPAQIPVPVSKDPPAPAQIPVPVTKDPLPPAPVPVPVSKHPPAPAHVPVSIAKEPPACFPVSVSMEPPAPAHIPLPVSTNPPDHIPLPVSTKPPAPDHIPLPVSTNPPAPAHIQPSLSKAPPAPTEIHISQSKVAPAPVPCPVTSIPAPLTSETPVSAKMRGQASVDGQFSSLSSTDAQGGQTAPCKLEENESRASLQGPPRELRAPQVKAPGISKIPVVGGGKAGKLPVRDSQHADDEERRDPPTPVLDEERPEFISHDTGRKDKISNVAVPTSKHSQEESQQRHQPKVLTSLPRDSRIPVKHGTQYHAACQLPQAKETTRTKIPVSKVPVRRVGNKPAAAAGARK